MMKKTAYATMFALVLSAVSMGALAGDAAKSGVSNESESSTSRNPITGSTTTTVKKKGKRMYKNSAGQNVEAKDEVTTKQKVSEDGTKSTITTDGSKSEEVKP
jgi:hypothetical protein